MVQWSWKDYRTSCWTVSNSSFSQLFCKFTFTKGYLHLIISTFFEEPKILPLCVLSSHTCVCCRLKKKISLSVLEKSLKPQSINGTKPESKGTKVQILSLCYSVSIFRLRPVTKLLIFNVFLLLILTLHFKVLISNSLFISFFNELYKLEELCLSSNSDLIPKLNQNHLN